MKYQVVFFTIVLVLVAGCATTQPASPSEQPELVAMTSLPPVSAMYPSNGLKLNVLFHVRGDGSIIDVKLMGSSGDADWDRAATDSMKQWRFAPLTQDNVAVERWVRNTIILQVQEPTVLTLGELNASTQQDADSLHTLLDAGSDFNELMKQVVPGSTEPRGKFLGAVDIARFPRHVRDALRKLGFNQVTSPLRVGTTYVIYKRYKPDPI